jgi:hypothetical protein
MLNHIRTYRIIPVGKLAAWMAATGVTEDPDGLGATASVYDVSEETPRTNVTHRSSASATAQAQLDLMNGWGFDANGYLIPPAGLEGCIVKIRVLRSAPLVSDPDPYAGMLSDNGLTTNVT